MTSATSIGSEEDTKKDVPILFLRKSHGDLVVLGIFFEILLATLTKK